MTIKLEDMDIIKGYSTSVEEVKARKRGKQPKKAYLSSRRMMKLILEAHGGLWGDSLKILKKYASFMSSTEDAVELQKRAAGALACIKILGSPELRHRDKKGKSSPRIYFF